MPTKQLRNALTDSTSDATPWLSVIGKALAYLCLSKAVEQEPEKYKRNLLTKVKFLQGLGLSQKDAAEAAGSSAASVKELHYRRRKKAKNGKAKKKIRR
jgi:DNA-directed RNA polymerase specialized sigma24 family protein